MHARRLLAIMVLLVLVSTLCAQTAYALERRVRLVVPGCV